MLPIVAMQQQSMNQDISLDISGSEMYDGQRLIMETLLVVLVLSVQLISSRIRISSVQFMDVRGAKMLDG